jgi:dihydroorotate dehydrogenase (fumarate)
MTSEYLGLRLRSPLVASPGPLTGRLDMLRELDRAGVGAVVLPSLFEEELVRDAARVHAGDEETFAGGSAFPDLDASHPGPDRYFKLIEDARHHLDAPVIASLNGTTDGGWVRYARLIEAAGASALELNIYLIAADFTATPREVERRYRDLVEAVRGTVRLPLAVKVGPYFTSLPSTAWSLTEAGADGLVLFNRFYQPDIDLATMTVAPDLALSTSAELRLPLRWIAILRGRVKGSLALTTGVHTHEDALKALLAGADVAMMTSALLRHGPGHVARVEANLRAWLAHRGYTSVEHVKGVMSQGASLDPEAYERANYAQTLASYTPDTSNT